MKYNDVKAARQAILEAALQYAREEGWYVFPVNAASKKPCFAGKFSNGRRWGNTRDPVEIERYWRRPRNLGLACGLDSGDFVLECDTPKGHAKLAEAGVDGRETLAALEADLGPLPVTLMAESPSGSRHYHWAWPITVMVRSRNAIAPGVDLKGEGGYVLLPPSLRKGEAYRWLNWGTPRAQIPDAWLNWILSRIGSRSPSSGTATVRTGGGRIPAPSSDAPSPVTCHLPYVRAEHAGRGIVFEDCDELIFALQWIKPHEISNDDWFRIGRALYDHPILDHERGRKEFVEWSDWSRECYPKPEAKTPQQQWRDYGRYPREEHWPTVGRIFALADEHSNGEWRHAFNRWKEDDGED